MNHSIDLSSKPQKEHFMLTCFQKREDRRVAYFCTLHKIFVLKALYSCDCDVGKLQLRVPMLTETPAESVKLLTRMKHSSFITF